MISIITLFSLHYVITQFLLCSPICYYVILITFNLHTIMISIMLEQNFSYDFSYIIMQLSSHYNIISVMIPITLGSM